MYIHTLPNTSFPDKTPREKQKSLQTYRNKKAQSYNYDWVLCLTMAHSEVRHTFLLAKPYGCQECHSDAHDSTDACDDSDFLFFLCHLFVVSLIIIFAVSNPCVRNETAKLRFYFKIKEGNMLNRLLLVENPH